MQLTNGLKVGDICFHDGALKSVVHILEIVTPAIRSKNVYVIEVESDARYWVYEYRLITLKQGKVEIDSMIKELQSLAKGIDIQLNLCTQLADDYADLEY